MKSLGGWMMIAIAALVAGGCESSPNTAGAQRGGLGQARLALGLPGGGPVRRAEYDLTFVFLESDPPETYGSESLESVASGGELLAILPCQTGADGTGLNQVDVSARLWLTPDGPPVSAGATALFECKRNADTQVNVVITILGALDAGFVDLDIALGGVLCAAKVDWKTDAWLGVCPESSCGDPRSVFLFANTCRTLSGREPSWWLCGSPTEWSVDALAAHSFFSVPEPDGAWSFGVIALDELRMSQVDPTLTDASGALRIFAGLDGSRAVLEKRDGVITRSDIERVQYDFAALLQTPPSPATGLPGPRLLLVADNGELGATVTYQERFGPCDVPAVGVGLYAGKKVLDVRVDDDASVDVWLAEAGLATTRAQCVAGWNGTEPVVTCGAPTPLGAVDGGEP